MQIYVFLADGFEEIEAIAPIDIFRRAKIDVTTISISDNKKVTGSHGISIFTDSIFSETDFDADSILFLPGGMPGTLNLDAHSELKSLLKKHNLNSGKIAAICAAPLVLGKSGLLTDKEAICYPGYESQLFGAKISENNISKAGNIYTAKAAGFATEFALMIVSELINKDIANEIRNAMFL